MPQDDEEFLAMLGIFSLIATVVLLVVAWLTHWNKVPLIGAGVAFLALLCAFSLSGELDSKKQKYLAQQQAAQQQSVSPAVVPVVEVEPVVPPEEVNEPDVPEVRVALPAESIQQTLARLQAEEQEAIALAREEIYLDRFNPTFNEAQARADMQARVAEIRIDLMSKIREVLDNQ